jgi:hypothetical protein
MRCVRPPSPGVQPPITNSWRPTFLIFTDAPERRLVATVQAFGDDPLQLLRGAGGQLRDALAHDVVGSLPRL